MNYSKKGLFATATLILALTYSPLAYSFNLEAAQAYNKALDLYINGNSTEAIEQFEKAVQLDPKFADAYYNLGSIYRYTGDMDKAEESFRKAMTLNPEDSNINYDLGIIYIQKKDYNKAMNHLKLVKQSDDKFNEAQNRIGFVEERLKATDLIAKNPVKPKAKKEIAKKETKKTENKIFKPDEKAEIAVTKEVAKNAKVAEAQIEKKEAKQNSYNSVDLENKSQPLKIEEEKIAAVNFMAIEDSSSTGKLTISPKNTIVKEKKAEKFNGHSIKRNAVKTFAEGFNGPTGIVRDKQGNLFVANYSENKIYKIDENGNKTLFASSDDINGPIGLAIDDDNNIFVANYLSNSIAVIEQDGNTSTIVTGLKKPYFIYFDVSGSLYVTEQESNTISKINMTNNKGS